MGLSTFLATHGISHHTSPPQTLEHNGFSERCHCHIVKTGLALLSLGPFFPFPSGHMPFLQLYISLIISPHLHFRCPLHITSYSGLLPTTLNFVSLVVCVIHGFDLTQCINLLLVPILVSSLATRLPKVHTFVMILPLPRPTTPVMFVFLSPYFSCLESILLFLGLISPPLPHGSLSLLSTRPRL